METSKSPRTVMRVAYALASAALPPYSSRFSRHDFTLTQLVACLVVKDMMKRSYRGAEALLRDSRDWLADVGLERAPDHNTLCRASKVLLAEHRVNRVLDVMAAWAEQAKLLGLGRHPLAIDSTTFDSHHVSRHYERHCHETRQRMKARDRKKDRKSSRARTARALPKMAIAIATKSHLILSVWVGTGAGGDQPHLGPVLLAAKRRVPNRTFKVVADAGYDGEASHELARDDMGLTSLIPPNSGRPRRDGKSPGGRWRRVMARVLGTRDARKRSGYTSRWQVETAISMKKRNQGAALAGKTAWSRRRDMLLRALTHNVMIL